MRNTKLSQKIRAFRHKSIVSILLVSAILAIILAKFDFYPIEFTLYDAAFVASPLPPVSGKIVLVLYDEKTRDNTKHGLRMQELLQTIEALQSTKPLAIVLAPPARVTYEPEELRRIQAYAAKSKNFYYVLEYSRDAKGPSQKDLAVFAPDITPLENSINQDIHLYGGGTVSRRANVKTENAEQSSATLSIAQIVNPKILNGPIHSTFEGFGRTSIWIRHREKNQIATLSMSDVWQGLFDPATINGKIVMFGNADHTWSDDYTKTPLDKTPYSVSVSQLNASIIETFIHNDAILRIDSTSARILISLIFACIALLMLFHGSLKSSVIGISGLIIFLISLAMILFAGFQIWLPWAHVVISLAIIYFFAMPIRLIQAARQESILTQNLALSKMTAKNVIADRGFRMALQVAHDIRSPLGALKALESVLASKIDSQFLDVLQMSITRINKIAEDLLSSNRQIGKSKIQMPVVELRSLLESLLKSYRLSWKACTFNLESSESSIPISIDGTQLERALSNLINNAIESHPTQEATIQIHLSKTKDGMIHIEISDNGQGIPDNIKSKLFQVGASEGKAKGSGLGLHQARSVFTELGGELLLKQTGKNGTTFLGSFPINRKSQTTSVRLKAKVIAADDSAEALALMCEIIKAAGRDVIACKSISEAESKIAEQEGAFSLFTDLVFTNSERNGIDLLQIAAAKTGSFADHCLCTTVANTPELIEAAHSLGVQLISKEQLSGLLFERN